MPEEGLRLTVAMVTSRPLLDKEPNYFVQFKLGETGLKGCQCLRIVFLNPVLLMANEVLDFVS